MARRAANSLYLPLVDVAADPADDMRRALGPGALVAGLDEVGRGPLAGPVVAAAVVLSDPVPDALHGLNDSKKLSATQRVELARRIETHAVAYAVAFVEADDVDAMNILRASLHAMATAFAHCEARAGQPVRGAVVDGNQKVLLPAHVTQRTVIGGDAKSRPIMAASILAKVARDARMEQEHARFPQYGFAQHKGYGTAEHLAALRAHGACVLHRKSFAPVRDVLAGVDTIARDTPSPTAKGRAAEARAAEYLASRGYRIVGHNVRSFGGEIDVVATDGDVLVFVEVRKRAKHSDAIASVAAKKRTRLVRAADAYLAEQRLRTPCRFDVVTVADDGIALLQNAFTLNELTG